ncbi:MAG: hypothetical protein HZB73_00230, partial [Nitrosarchaeum sp.]|nr:hypothetical protein [Nitrosarchaeum sp.]
KKWFDTNFSQYSSIYEAVGLDEPKTETPKTETPKTETPKTETPKTETPKTETPKTETPKFGICGAGTKLIDGICTVVDMPKVKPWWKFW